MTWSLGEARALTVKAARGAGLDWGLAEEAGFAIWMLQKSGMPGLQSLASYLDWYQEQVGKSTSRVNDECPLILGTQLSDFPFSGSRTIETVVHPLLICPFLAIDPFHATEKISQDEANTNEAAENRNLVNGHPAYTVIFNNAKIIVSRDRIRSDASREALLAPTATCNITATAQGEETTIQQRVSTRIPETEVTAYRQLESFASKTYAPATEASRISGAGSGLSDND